MKSVPEPDQVLEDLGEKPVQAIARCVARAKADLKSYREMHPQWAAEHSERGLANWINDRLWAHLAPEIEGIPGMDVVESGPTRETTVGVNYRIRMKRHDFEGHVASYPTLGFLEFATQPKMQLPGMEEVRLIAGYEWDRDLRDMGAAVISLRDGKDNVLWKVELPLVRDDESGGEETGEVVTPQQPKPAPPTVEVPETIGHYEESQEDA